MYFLWAEFIYNPQVLTTELNQLKTLKKDEVSLIEKAEKNIQFVKKAKEINGQMANDRCLRQSDSPEIESERSKGFVHEQKSKLEDGLRRIDKNSEKLRGLATEILNAAKAIEYVGNDLRYVATENALRSLVDTYQLINDTLVKNKVEDISSFTKEELQQEYGKIFKNSEAALKQVIRKLEMHEVEVLGEKEVGKHYNPEYHTIDKGDDDDIDYDADLIIKTVTTKGFIFKDHDCPIEKAWVKVEELKSE